jgi:ubiquinone/menaquinone biosynthesis C-methylase UbiE
VYEAIYERFAKEGLTQILDSGCGSGDGCPVATKLGLKPTGIDPADDMVAMAQRRFPEVEFKQAGVEKLPFDAEAFDAISAVNSFHFSPQMPAGAREMFRVLRKGGLVAINSVGPRESFESEQVFRALLALVPNERKCERRFVDPFRVANSGVVDMLLEDAGFEIEGQTFVDQSVDFADYDKFYGVFSLVALYVAVAEVAGRDAVDQALRAVADKFTQPDGRIVLKNDARIVFGRKVR